jgi:hypothetical protein
VRDNRAVGHADVAVAVDDLANDGMHHFAASNA